MRVIFSTVSLLVVLAIVGVLVKKQLGGSSAVPSASGVPAATSPAAPQVQSQQVQQVQQQVQEALQDALQQARPISDEK